MDDDLFHKVQGLRALYRSKQCNGILLERQNNLAWLFRGRTYINLASVQAVVDVVINDEAVHLITTNIEAQRIVTEEWLGSQVNICEYPWHTVEQREKIVRSLTDGLYMTDAAAEDDIRNLRSILTEEEQRRYVQLGSDVGEAMEAACFYIKQGMTEQSAAAYMAMQCMERGIEPIILLAAADERIRQYRHPLPTLNTIKDTVMLVIGGRRDGLCVGVTRFVAFSEPSQQLRTIRDAVLRLDAMLWEETRPEHNVSDLFQLLLDQYRVEGYPHEWELHHQGGLIGYNPREVRVTRHTSLIVRPGQAYAWNPSITGYKAEDTFIVGKEENVAVTRTPQLPHRTVIYNGQQVIRPDILVRVGRGR